MVEPKPTPSAVPVEAPRSEVPAAQALSTPTTAFSIRLGGLLFGGDAMPHIASGAFGALIGAALGAVFKRYSFGGIPPFFDLGNARSFRIVLGSIFAACILGSITGLWSVVFGGGRGGYLPVFATAAAVVGVLVADVFLPIGLHFRPIVRAFDSGIFLIGLVLSALFAAIFALGTSWPWWKRMTGLT